MTTKLCLKCGEDFPKKIKIDSKIHNLQRRNFCLICSPFKKHNTRDIRKEKKGMRGADYGIMSDTQKKVFNQRSYQFSKQRRMNRKLELIKIFGGKCSNPKCGYNKNYAALHFHHRNPKEKLFCISSHAIAARTWDALLLEAKKCDVLCGNCHAEYHYPQCEIIVDID